MTASASRGTRPALRAAALVATVLAVTPAAADRLTVAALHADAGLAGPSLGGARVSPDGRLVTVLRGREDDTRALDLWAFDAATGEARVLVRYDELIDGEEGALSEEEKNRRERQRIYETGIVTYQWDDAGERLLFPLGGDVYLYDLASASVTQVTDTPDAFETDARISPGGAWVSYVRNDELVVYDIDRAVERQVTEGAGGTVRNAVAEFVVQEEFDRSTGYWWSEDDERIVFTRIDEAPVQIVERLDFTPAGTSTVRQRYPFAGSDNVRIRLGITDVTGRAPTWIDLGDDPDIYVVDVVWHAAHPWVLRLDRAQRRLDLLKVDPATGASRVVLSESARTWVNVAAGFRSDASSLRPLPDGSFLWLSERTGWRHLYRYGADGEAHGAITSGSWPVHEVDCVDDEAGMVYFTGWRDTPIERHVFRVSLDGGTPQALTQAAGWHTADFSADCAVWIHRFSSTTQPPQVDVRGTQDDAGAARRFWLLENALDADHPYAPYLDSHLTWEFGRIEADDGTLLDYRLLVPATATSAHPAPAVQLVYGGPHAQTVARRWGRQEAYAQLLADEGYVVFRLDNRGAANRGKVFEEAIFQRMGQPEVADQAAGTRWLAGRPFVDGRRIAVQGWSYGGYMTLMMLGQQPDLYTAGIAGAPVTDWRTYDTAYTERYMGDPRSVPDAYDASSVLTHAKHIRNDTLLLLHGMADDNVVFQNSVDLMAALQEQGTLFRLMTYPGEKHGFRRRENRIHRDLVSLAFLRERLQPQAVAPDATRASPGP